MAVSITADVTGHTQAGCDAMLAAVGAELERARGSIAGHEMARAGAAPC